MKSRSYIEQVMDKCKHFNGIINDTCKVGVAYKDVRDETHRPFKFPCFLRHGCNTCPQAVFPTLEEAQEQRRKVDEMVKNMNIARTAIMEDIGEERLRQSVTGTIACPVCKTGTVGYRYAGSYNGHVHAHCSTQGCVSWME